jgi:hypothetical protein
VVLTGLAAQQAYTFRARSTDAAGNTATSVARPLLSSDPGLAVQTREEFRTGTWTEGLAVDGTGFGSLTMAGPGSASYTSTVLDSGQKVDWRRAVLHGSFPAGTGATVSVRTGTTPTPDPDWSSWTDPLDDGDPLGRSGRFLQYRVVLTATAVAVPRLTAIGFTHSGRLPQSPDHA